MDFFFLASEERLRCNNISHMEETSLNTWAHYKNVEVGTCIVYWWHDVTMVTNTEKSNITERKGKEEKM